MNTYKILFRGSLSEENEVSIASKYFEILDSRVKVQAGDFIIPRYSVLPFAKEFFEDLEYLKAKTINSYSQFNYIADLQNWSYDLRELTPKTWRTDQLYRLPEHQAVILKGETNSRKFEWSTCMYAENREAAGNVLGNLLKDSLISSQDIYIREFVPLKTFLIAPQGLPITNEYRIFVANGQIISKGYYWSAYVDELLEKGINLDPDQIPTNFLEKVIEIVKSNNNFFVIDVAETISGEWIVIELNAGEQSGLSCNKPEILYTQLANSIIKV